MPLEAHAQKPTSSSFSVVARVDRRVELMSIVARLAEYDEYVNNQFKSYAGDVDAYFEKYKRHPAVQYAIKLRNERSIAFDAVMAMAMHLSPPPALAPRVTFTESIPDQRWGKTAATEFADLLRQFYKDADCERFFLAHADMYRTAEERFQLLLNKIDFDWYRRFYKEVPSGTFNLCIGLLNGGCNYATKVVYPDKTEDLYAILGTWQVDEAGLPIYKDDTLPTVLHEFNHSFINHLVYANEAQFKASGEKILKVSAEKMRKLAYVGWQTMFAESLVRAAVIRYEFEHLPPQAAYKEIIGERNRGFLWMGELSSLLGVYENSRSAYPTFRSFFPMIASYFTDFAKRIDYENTRFAELCPRVVAVSPFTNDAQDVDPGITQLTVTFDRPLDTHAGYSINTGDGGDEHFPIDKVIGYSETGNAITLQVKLKPDWEYAFTLTSLSFRTKDGYPLREYTVRFKTKKQ